MIRPAAVAAILVCACGGTTLVQSPADAGADAETADVGADTTLRDASQCLACADSGTVGAGQDTGTDGSCGPLTCPTGCCDTTGQCINDTTTSQCGGSGSACVVCPGDAGAVCKGTCFVQQLHCDATNCPGCCAGPSWCATGDGDYECGHNGQECQACAPSRGTGACVPQQGGGGLCNGVQSCNATNCIGCCDGDICRTGAYNTQCGSGGVACQSCPADQECAQVDTPAGGVACQSTSACTVESCSSGCCYSATSGGQQVEECAVGTQDLACGNGGRGCVDCTMNVPAQHCANQTCQ